MTQIAQIALSPLPGIGTQIQKEAGLKYEKRVPVHG